MRRVVGLYRDAYAGFPRTVWVLALVLLVNRVGTMVIPFLALYLTRVQGLAADTAGGIVALYGVGGIVGNWIAGWTCDRFGAHRPMIVSLVLTAAGLPILAYLDGAGAIAVGVVVLSTVTEVFRPASMTAAAEAAPPIVRARALALMRLSINLGMAIGPAVGGLLAVHDYTLLFWVDGLTCLAAAGVALVLLPRRPSPQQSGSVTTAAAHDAPAHPRRGPWRDGPYLALLVLVLVLAIAFFQLMSTWPLYLRDVRGHGEDVIGALLAASAAFIALFEMPIVKLVERRDPLRVAAVGTFFIGAGFAVLPLLPGVAWVAGTIVIWTLGEMLALPMTNVAIVDRAPPGQLGRYIALYSQVWSLAFVLGPYLGTRLYEDVSPDAVWVAEGVVALVLPLGFLAIGRSSRRARTPDGGAPRRVRSSRWRRPAG